jgi:predicted ATPase
VGEEAVWLEGRCASYGAGAPYGPFVDALRMWIGADDGDGELALRTKLRARAGALLGAATEDLLPYLGLMLSIRLDPGLERELLALSADELSERQRGAYVAWATAVAGRRPLILAVDDLQWANRTTRELAERLLDLTERAAILLTVALRPDPASEAWTFRLKALGEYPHRAREVSLTPLSAEASRALLDALVPSGMFGNAVRNDVVLKAEGNPLFIEELVRVLLEGGERKRTWTITPGAAADLPPALEALLIARIDRLQEGPRRLAQVAAVVGREFLVSVAAAVAGSADPDADLAALLRGDLVREIRRLPELECTFRHGLVQEAALATLTPASLRELYGRVGNAMRDRFAPDIDEHLERLAFYFYRSDEPQTALEYLERAAERASTLEAFDQAEELWSRTRRLAERTGDRAAAGRAVEGLEALARRGAG